MEIVICFGIGFLIAEVISISNKIDHIIKEEEDKEQ